LKYEYADDDDEDEEEADEDDDDGRRMNTCYGIRSKYIHVPAHALMSNYEASCETNGGSVLVLGRQF